MEDYRVNLDIYNGPLDLLLYLIRREEVDIHDIPIARITEQYVHYVSLLKQLDPNLAGEFLLMAATLMELKTRMLLPAQTADGQGDEDIGLDPRAELVRQLMEYKAFKDAAGDLREAYTLQSQRFPRQQPPDQADQGEVDLADVQVWDLLDAFSNLLKAVGAEARPHEVVYDDTPLELHAADITDRLGREGRMTFDMIFQGRTERIQIIGLFLALLELIRRKEVLVGQDHNFGRIEVWLNPNPRRGGPDQGGLEQNGSAVESQVASEVANKGQYISENASVDGSDGHPRGEDPTARP